MKELHIDTRVFRDLLDNQNDFNQVFNVFYTTIMLSFRVIDTAALGQASVISQEEVKRRFLICEKWFRTMRGDLGYSLQRTLEYIPKALVCEITGQEFIPDAGMRGYAATVDALQRAVIEGYEVTDEE